MNDARGRDAAEYFGLRVAAERRHRHMALRKVSELAGLTGWSTIERIKAGNNVTILTAVKVAAVLDLDLGQATQPIRCTKCLDLPPAGFTCDTCGASRQQPAPYSLPADVHRFLYDASGLTSRTGEIARELLARHGRTSG